jgi:hypothetical protein
LHWTDPSVNDHLQRQETNRSIALVRFLSVVARVRRRKLLILKRADVVSQIFTSWNRTLNWLKGLESLRMDKKSDAISRRGEGVMARRPQADDG